MDFQQPLNLAGPVVPDYQIYQIQLFFCVYLLEFHDHLLGQSGYHVCIEFN